jgi:hypothetical protein
MSIVGESSSDVSLRVSLPAGASTVADPMVSECSYRIFSSRVFDLVLNQLNQRLEVSLLRMAGSGGIETLNGLDLISSKLS